MKYEMQIMVALAKYPLVKCPLVKCPLTKCLDTLEHMLAVNTAVTYGLTCPIVVDDFVQSSMPVGTVLTCVHSDI